ncbi:indole-3-acetic acid-induced ARG7 [Olea europaea subsp. europaea]|uniref:Indole-3-acetic acid-induced ARG7 n=1 Tax=Olea europaea subsp. europaea TaxID=158383 RepID=A0A8S0PI19_OLEEU|nr:indole-3-acetic acid-induced ARG7 [Olea europaea subsp. europaea]
MELSKGKFMNAFTKKWQRIGGRVVPSSASEKCCCQWSSLWPSMNDDQIVPTDVPKGHLVVYVGEYHKRFVIKITLLNHPLFKALLDQAQELYGFTADHSKLHIPCDENFFLTVVQCAKSPSNRRIPLCL